MSAREAPAWAQRAEPNEERLVERLVPIARELGARVSPRGCTLRQLRGCAKAAGVLVGRKTPAQMGVLKRAMQRAGLSRINGSCNPQRFHLFIPREAPHARP